MDGNYVVSKWNGPKSLLNQRVCKIESANKNRLNDDYLYYTIQYPIQKIEALTPQTTVKHLSTKDIRNVRIPLPPLVEQRGIVEVLGTVDECIRLTDGVIGRAEELKRGLMQRLLTRGIGHTDYRPTPLGEIPATWKIDNLEKNSIEIKSGFASGKRDDNGIIQLRMNNVSTDGRLILDNYIKVPIPKNIEDYILKEMDILFNNTNSIDLIGKSTIFKKQEDDITYSNHFTRIRVDIKKLIPEWLLYNLIQLWEKGYFKRICHRHVGQAGINQTDIKKIKIPIPPLDEQKSIIAIIKNLDEKRDIELEKLHNLNSLKKGLMQVLLSGKVRVEMRENGLQRIRDGGRPDHQMA